VSERTGLGQRQRQRKRQKQRQRRGTGTGTGTRKTDLEPHGILDIGQQALPFLRDPDALEIDFGRLDKV